MRIIAMVIGMTVVTAALGDGVTMPKVDPLEKTAAAQLARIGAECAGASACRAAGQVGTLISLRQLHGAYVHLDSYGARAKLLASIKKSQGEYAATSVPIFTALRAEPAAQLVLPSVAKFESVAGGCSAGLTQTKGETDDAYRDRQDACTAEVAFSGKQLQSTLGVHVNLASYRDSSWGDSKEAVIAKEGQPKYRKPNMLGYDAEIGGFAAIAIFEFVDDQLVSGGYAFNVQHAAKNSYIEDYDRLSQLLREKYGATGAIDRSWKDDLYRSRPSDWGMAVATGRMTQYEIWSTDETMISHSLRGDNFEIVHTMRYESKRFEAVRQKANSRDAGKGL